MKTRELFIYSLWLLFSGIIILIVGTIFYVDDLIKEKEEYPSSTVLIPSFIIFAFYATAVFALIRKKSTIIIYFLIFLAVTTIVTLFFTIESLKMVRNTFHPRELSSECLFYIRFGFLGVMKVAFDVVLIIVLRCYFYKLQQDGEESVEEQIQDVQRANDRIVYDYPTSRVYPTLSNENVYQHQGVSTQQPAPTAPSFYEHLTVPIPTYHMANESKH